jgi:hypothetical protein
MNTATVPDPEDVCSFGHQLAPGSDPIVIKTYDDSGILVNEETKLLRRHACMGPGGIYAGGIREVDLDERGRQVAERVTGADPHDHGMTPTDPTRLIPYPCAHALPREMVNDPTITDTAGAVPALAGSFGRAHWLTFQSGVPPIALIARCPVCLGGEAPDWRA